MHSLSSVVVLLAACAKPVPPPVIANVPARSTAIVPEPEAAGCSVELTVKLRVAGEPAIAELVACDLGEEPSDVEELAIKKRASFVKFTRAGQRTQRTLIAEWTDGWEWGGAVTLEGQLVATTTPNDAVLVRFHRHSTDVLSPQLIAFALQDDRLQRVGTWSHDEMTVRFSAANDIAHVESCVLGDPALAHDGCGQRDDADFGPAFELRWTGAKIEETPRARTP